LPPPDRRRAFGTAGGGRSEAFGRWRGMTPKLNHCEVQIFLGKVLTHRLTQIRRELLDYLLQVQIGAETSCYGLTLNLDGSIRMVEVTALEWQEFLKQVLETQAQPQPSLPHPLMLQDLQEGRCTLLRGSLVLGISMTKAKALRKGEQPTRPQVAPVTEIFGALLAGTRKKEIAVRFGVTTQTVSNVRSRVLDMLLYQAVQQFVRSSKVA
jgi:hypothetical protein